MKSIWNDPRRLDSHALPLPPWVEPELSDLASELINKLSNLDQDSWDGYDLRSRVRPLYYSREFKASS